jgi:hypothetical protein
VEDGTIRGRVYYIETAKHKQTGFSKGAAVVFIIATATIIAAQGASQGADLASHTATLG